MATTNTPISDVSPADKITASTHLRGPAAVTRGDFGQALKRFRPDCALVFVSRVALGARRSGSIT